MPQGRLCRIGRETGRQGVAKTSFAALFFASRDGAAVGALCLPPGRTAARADPFAGKGRHQSRGGLTRNTAQ
ncbi:MAG: hypothetical protein CMI51_11945 [Paracoccus sp.]|nr:hypothetical protein [Paracoccus sp. (in: a-proteobacteria)]